MELVKGFFKAVANVFFAFLALCFIGVAIYGMYEATVTTMRFVKAGCFVLPPVLMDVCLAGLCMFIALLFARFAFSAKLQNVRYSTIILGCIVTAIGGGAFSLLDTNLVDSFRYCRYVPYIEEYRTRTASKGIDINYDDYDVVRISGSFTELSSSFRAENIIEIVEDETLTDKLGVVVYYKGIPVEINLRIYDDEVDFYVWEEDYDENKITADDKAYMYKNKIDIEYADKYAVEKVVFKTAYPEKIDVSGIYVRGNKW